MSITNKFHSENGVAKITPKSLYDFFKEYAVYNIPLYQRPYSWSIKEVNTLLIDIKKAIDKDDDWFLGPIFTSSEFNDTNNTQRDINLLDGQQRITTLFLIARILYSLDYFFVEGSEGYQFSADVTDEEKNKELEERKDNINDFIKKILFISDPTTGLTTKFLTDLSSRDVLDEWTIETLSIDSKEQYDSKKNLRVTDESEFLITKKNLNKNISFLYQYFEDMVNQTDGLIDLNKFTKFYLTRLYFIHIPLKNKNDVLDIFESINNRGKKLNLTDTLRFISIKSSINDQDKQNALNDEWSKFYKIIENQEKFFPDTDVFLERFINSMATTEEGKSNPNGYTNDFDRIEFFKNKYSDNYLTGLKEINHALGTIDFIFDEQKFLSKIREKTNEDESKVIALIKLLELTFEISKNSHVLFIGYLSRVHNESVHQSMVNSPNLEHHSTLLGFIWQFVKYVIAIEIYKNDDSNSVRTTFYGLAQKINESSIYDGENTSLNDLSKMNGNNETFVQNLAFQKFLGAQKKETTLLLYYFQFLHNYRELDTSSRINYKSCDHIIPQTWYNKSCWKDEIIDNWKLIDEDDENSKRNYTEGLDLDDRYVKNVVNYMENLWNDDDSKESFIQLIGNKVYIPGRTNSIKGNRCWVDEDDPRNSARAKLTEYFENNRNSSYAIPSYPQFHTLEKVNLHSIVKRTSFIVKTICENSDKRFGSISSNS